MAFHGLCAGSFEGRVGSWKRRGFVWICLRILAVITLVLLLTPLAGCDSREAARKKRIDLSPLVKALEENNIEKLKAILDGLDLEARDRLGYSALDRAALHGTPEAIRATIEAGADPSLRGIDGCTPVFHAAISFRDARLYEEEVPRALATLLESGADPNARSVYDDTPLHVAAQHEHLGSVRLLLEHGADPTAKNAEGKRPVDLVDERVAISREKARRIRSMLQEGMATYSERK